MPLDIGVKILGWGMTIVPAVIFVVISGIMIWGAGEDDEVIRGLTLLGVAIFGIGLIVLALAYFTTFLTFAPEAQAMYIP